MKIDEKYLGPGELKLVESARKATRGQWFWTGYVGDFCLSLVSTARWRPIVMSFARWGMQRAQPMFRDADRDLLVPAKETFRYKDYGANEVLDAKHPDAKYMETVYPDAFLEVVESLVETRKALELAAGRFEILADRFMACHVETGDHGVSVQEAPAFASEAREAAKRMK
jgi:hypothetical protein